MTTIKRYDPEVYASDGLGRPGIMYEDLDGSWVDYEDYADLQNQIESYKVNNQALEDLWEAIVVNTCNLGCELKNELNKWEIKYPELSSKLSSQWIAEEEEWQMKQLISD